MSRWRWVRKWDTDGKMRNKYIKLDKGEAMALRRAAAFLRDSDTDASDEGADVETGAQDERVDRKRREGNGGDGDIMKGQCDKGIHRIFHGEGHGRDKRCVAISSDSEGDDGQNNEDVEVDAEMRDVADGSF